MISGLAVLANKFDSCGLFAAANILDGVIRSIASDIAPPFSKDDTLIIADAIGMDLSKAEWSLEDFQEGLRVEMEHGTRDPETDVVHENYLSVGRIAWAHLKEDPAYYSKLAKIEK
jgi:hypothetical protein